MNGHFTKPSQNAFNILSQVGDRSTTNLNNIALITNYLQERTQKQKMPINLIDFLEISL